MVGFFISGEVLGEGRQQLSLVSFLNGIFHHGRQHLQRDGLAVSLQDGFLRPVGVPDPFGHVAEPRLAAVGLDLPHRVIIAEPVEAAENLPYHADKQTVPGVSGGNGPEVVPRLRQGIHQRRQPLAIGKAKPLHYGGDQVNSLLVHRLRPTGLSLIRPYLQQHLPQDVPGNQTDPEPPDHIRGMVGQAVVAVLAGGRNNRDFLQAHVRQHSL